MANEISCPANCAQLKDPDHKCVPETCGMTLENKEAIFIEPLVIHARLNLPEPKEE